MVSLSLWQPFSCKPSGQGIRLMAIVPLIVEDFYDLFLWGKNVAVDSYMNCPQLVSIAVAIGISWVVWAFSPRWCSCWRIKYLNIVYTHMLLHLLSMFNWGSAIYPFKPKHTKWQSKWWDKHRLALPQRLLRPGTSLCKPRVWQGMIHMSQSSTASPIISTIQIQTVYTSICTSNLCHSKPIIN